jgi:predicted metal-binding membrane protein
MTGNKRAIPDDSGRELILRRDKTIVLVGLALVTVLAWAYMIRMAVDMSGAGMEIQHTCMMSWEMDDLIMVFTMWSVMMVAMMLPSALPMILLFTTLNRQRSETMSPLIPTGLFVVGYLAAWVAYSALATLAQWGLHASALLSHSMSIANPYLGGCILAASGIFQWTPFREACMTHCRSPIGFLLTHWKEGRVGALMMGLTHGTFCVGCCWMLMTISLVLGVMNMLWMAVLTILMFWEKVISPNSIWLSRAAGAVLTIWGMWVIAEAAMTRI